MSEGDARVVWRRKRWWVVGAVWLALPVAYLLGSGPAYFALRRGWIEEGTYYAAYKPIGDFLYHHVPAGRRAFVVYLRWWWEMAG